MRNNKPNRKNKAQSTVELVVGLLVLVPLVLVLFDLAVIVLGVQVNDQTCRQAARAAASGDPNTALSRAQAIIDRANKQQKANSIVNRFTLVTPITFSPSSIPTDADDLAANFGGTVSGTVTVETIVDIYPFVVPIVYSGGSAMQFRASQTYPITFVVLNPG
ncbi:MAG: hypothetical protein K8F91_04530 [Candidatus Obscuribacterales bacterium]|nr:hypothetical protein [Candidatus Obscuribacterales bacterium]